MCKECQELAQHVTHLVNELTKNTAATDKLLKAIQRAKIPKMLSQARQYAVGTTQLNMQQHTQTQELLNVNAILVVVSSAATLVIQERQIPINATQLLYFGENGMLIRPEDTITLTQATAGPIGLEFFGEELADRGKRW